MDVDALDSIPSVNRYRLYISFGTISMPMGVMIVDWFGGPLSPMEWVYITFYGMSGSILVFVFLVLQSKKI